MKGDFSRDSFDPTRGFSRVLMQQGRVQLDADWNEQVAIQLRYLRSLAADVIGPHGGPAEGFLIEQGTTSGGDPIKNDVLIRKGHYYVDGWLCDNGTNVLYGSQASERYLPAVPALENGKRYLAYLDVWERHVSSVEADGAIEIDRRRPALLRELALGGPDTATRAQLVWQVKVGTRIRRPDDTVVEIPDTPPAGGWRDWVEGNWDAWVENWQPGLRGRLGAEAKRTDGEDTEPCTISPESRYRGLENQLYRVEIHRSGGARTDASGSTGATFKWSRENGSVAFPVTSISGETITLGTWWRDDRLGLSEGNWVEVVNDTSVLGNRAEALTRVVKVDRDEMTVTLDRAPVDSQDDPALHPVVRRWDHRRPAAGAAGATRFADDNALFVVEDGWIALEDGIRIQFQRSSTGVPHYYRTGDYWLIPARASIGDVLWPKTPGTGGTSGSNGLVPEPQGPRGVEHHFAPLAIILLDQSGRVTVEADLRRQFTPLAGT